MSEPSENSTNTAAGPDGDAVNRSVASPVITMGHVRAGNYSMALATALRSVERSENGPKPAIVTRVFGHAVRYNADAEYMLPPAEAPAILHNLAPEFLGYSEALQAADWFYKALNEPDFAARIMKIHGEDTFVGPDWSEVKSDNLTAQDHTWRHRWYRDHPFAFAVGLRQLTTPLDGDPKFRLAMRFQSNRQIRPRVLRTIHEDLRLGTSMLVSWRWSSPVVLQSHLSGDPTGWVVKPSGQFDIGAPANISEGAVGSLTLLLKEKGRYVGLTSGHTMKNRGEGIVGTPVYSPPRSVGANGQEIGKIREVEALPTLRLSQHGHANGSEISPITHDYALIDVGDFNLPHAEQHRRMGTHMIDGLIYDRNPLPGLGILKSPARTREATGIVTATDFRLEAWDPIQHRTVYAEGLVEMELNPGYQILAGDSGALIAASVDGKVQPFAQLVAGVRSAKLSAFNGRNRSAIYGTPLTAVKAISGMEIA